jgi:hypothetical protein
LLQGEFIQAFSVSSVSSEEETEEAEEASTFGRCSSGEKWLITQEFLVTHSNSSFPDLLVGLNNGLPCQIIQRRNLHIKSFLCGPLKVHTHCQVRKS